MPATIDGALKMPAPMTMPTMSMTASRRPSTRAGSESGVAFALAAPVPWPAAAAFSGPCMLPPGMSKSEGAMVSLCPVLSQWERDESCEMELSDEPCGSLQPSFTDPVQRPRPRARELAVAAGPWAFARPGTPVAGTRSTTTVRGGTVPGWKSLRRCNMAKAQVCMHWGGHCSS